MIKTVTLTFHAPCNNGAFLQAYALQKAIKTELGDKVENQIIDFQSPQQKKLYSIFRPWKNLSNIAKNAVSLLHYSALKRRKKNFTRLHDQFLDMTKEVSSEADVIKICNSADAVIVGSDQVWNTSALDTSRAYFLADGVTSKKISYAVSCGANGAARVVEKYKKEIEDFDFVSVREKTAVEMLKPICKDLEVAADPTLLINEHSYEQLFDKKPIVRGKYIFFYSIKHSETVLKTVRKISEITGLPVITVFTTYRTIYSKKYGVKIIWDAGPSQFLNLIYNAELVLTNSFHGTVFSTIFKKNFFYCCEENEKGFSKDDRLDDYLNALGLERRVSFSTDETTIKEMINVDYSGVDDKIEEMKKDSIDFLKKALL